MAYQIRRAEQITEVLELLNEDGSVAKTIQVRLDAPGLAKKVSEKYVDLLKAQSLMIKKETDELKITEAIETYSRIAMDLFEAVFGKDDAKEILDFYHGDILEMCQGVQPFVTDVLVPRIRKISQDSRKKTLAKYKKKGLFGR